MPLTTDTIHTLKTDVTISVEDQRGGPITSTLPFDLRVGFTPDGASIHLPQDATKLHLSEGDLRSLLKAVYPGE